MKLFFAVLPRIDKKSPCLPIPSNPQIIEDTKIDYFSTVYIYFFKGLRI
tara:strand:+ start:3057 stop:3203 length:147 start_codon:yes stop_codon:yes gene_type:complete